MRQPTKHILTLTTVLLAATTVSCTMKPTPELSVSPDGRYLLQAPAKPFVWIGDTAWELFHKLDRQEAIAYLDDRAAKGFNVVQAVALAELDSLGTPNAYGQLPLVDRDPTRPNEAYFGHVDFVIEAAAARGIYTGLLPTWGDKVPSDHSPENSIIFKPDNARDYAAFLARRYQNYPIIWILGGDRNIDSEEAKAIWNAMGQAIKEIAGDRQLVTYHPRGNQTSATWFAKAEWLDFHMYQIGHQSRNENLLRLAARTRSASPRKPYVDGEPAYEDIPVRFWEYMDFSQQPPVPADVLDEQGVIAKKDHFAEGFVTAHDVRLHAYWDFLSGAAGYTYGHNAIWQMYRPGDRIAIPTLQDWKAALDQPGASQMIHLRRLLESRPLLQLRPGGDVLADPIPPGAQVAHAADRSYALAYLPDGFPVTAKLNIVSGPQANAWWFNPRDGTTNAIGRYPTQDQLTLTPPIQGSQADWVLLIDATQANYPAPPSP